jgi:hypothetical protein
MPKRAIWELFLLMAGLVYVVMALCDINVESLAFVAAFVALAAQELVHAHREKR